jgi:hypothetical protein
LLLCPATALGQDALNRRHVLPIEERDRLVMEQAQRREESRRRLSEERRQWMPAVVVSIGPDHWYVWSGYVRRDR